MNINICELLRNLPLRFVPFGVTVTVLNELVQAAGKSFAGDEHSSTVVFFFNIFNCVIFDIYLKVLCFFFILLSQYVYFGLKLPFYIHDYKPEFRFLHIAFVLLCYQTP